MHVPDSTEWFIAEQVQEIRVAEEMTSLVYLNSVLVKADSQETAFARAMLMGEALNTDYENSDGESVRSRFRGLSNLNPVHDKLEDGAELWFHSREDQTAEQIDTLVRSKDQLFGEHE